VTRKNARFSISEIEDADGNITEWIVSDSESDYDPVSFGSEQEALDEVETLMESEGIK
jgi:hypothetical protein